MKKFSIIILYHSNKHYLDWALESILKTTNLNDVEIILIINNSNLSEYTVEVKYSSIIKVIRINENLGHARAANIGAREAKGEYLIFSDHDLIFQNKWLENLYNFYLSNENLGAVSCKVLNPHTNRILDFGISFTDFNSPHPFQDLPYSHQLVKENSIFQAVCTGGYLIKKTTFNLLHGFDEQLGTMYTDIDLCLRLKDLNLKCGASANSLLYHYGGEFSLIDRSYKDKSIKADIKGYFMRKNAHRIDIDMSSYYKKSIDYFKLNYKVETEYIACNMMNVANPKWYENEIKNMFNIVDSIFVSSKVRDSYVVPLFETLGFNIMKQNIPIIYFVDRFVALEKNELWWENRACKSDIVVDRNGNILPVQNI